ncbi:MAG: DNA primase [Armatimonadota bacterium]
MSSFRYPLDEIRERCDLVEIVSSYVALKKRGRNFIGLCPFHNEKTPSFSIDPDKQIWHCFGCSIGGDVFSFVQKMENISFPEAVEMLAKKVGIELPKTAQETKAYNEKDRIIRANSLACAFFQVQLSKNEIIKDYLKNRGLTETAIEKYKLGYAPESWDMLGKYLISQGVNVSDAARAGLISQRQSGNGYYDRFRGRIIFPISDISGKIIAFGGRAVGDENPKYLNSPDTPVFSKNKVLYGLNLSKKAISDEDRAIVVEGYMDLITVREAGFENTVATLGTALTDSHVNLLSRFTKNVVLAFDADSAGINAALRSWPMFEQSGFNVRIIRMPAGEDPDSLLKDGDITVFARLLEKSLPVIDFRLRLVLKQHDLKNDEGKTAALKECIQILAEVDNLMERERLIKLLARYHPNFSTGTTKAEDHIRYEVRKQQRLKNKNSASQTVKSVENNEQTLSVSSTNILRKTHGIILSKILNEKIDVLKVFDAIPQNEFEGDDFKELAKYINDDFVNHNSIDVNRILEKARGSKVEAVLSSMLVNYNESEFNYSIDELIDLHIEKRNIEKRKRLSQLAVKFQDGQVAKDDPEYEEYLSLLKSSSRFWRR